MRGNGYEGVLDLLWWAGPCSVYLQFNFLLMGGAMSPPCSLPWGDLLQKDLCQQSGDPRTVVFSAHDLTAGHCQLTALPENPGHSQASVAQSLEGSLLLFPGSWCPQAFVCALQESVFPVLWKFCNQIPLALKVKFPGASQSFCQTPRLGNLLWALELLQQCKNFLGRIVLQFVGHGLRSSIVALMATSSKRTYATCCASQVGCSQSPVPGVSHYWLMPPQETLKHSKAGLDQCRPFKNLSLSVDFKLLLDGMLSDLWIAQWSQLDFKNLLGWILLCNSMCLFLVWFFFLPLVPTLLSLILIPSISLTQWRPFRVKISNSMFW